MIDHVAVTPPPIVAGQTVTLAVFIKNTSGVTTQYMGAFQIAAGNGIGGPETFGGAYDTPTVKSLAPNEEFVVTAHFTMPGSDVLITAQSISQATGVWVLEQTVNVALTLGAVAAGSSTWKWVAVGAGSLVALFAVLNVLSHRR
jgi:hypothetical protein